MYIPNREKNIMEFFTFSTRVLAYYLTVVAIVGSISQILIFVSAATATSETSGLASTIKTNALLVNESDIKQRNPQLKNSSKNVSPQWNFILHQSILLYEITFPVTSTILDGDQDTLGNYPVQSPCTQNNSTDISISAILLTLLSSFFLVKGSWQMDYSSCQFWYYIQVGSLLLSCMKIFILTIVGSWNAVTNVGFTSILFALIQLWLVQNFMENLRRLAENTRQKKCHTQIFAMNDFDLETLRL